ncbi:hypothetical protein [Flavobacterium sp. CF136]|uniref:hypothetical protein n=1 Tax=Flavobacterium sp. (strain CF136) TaxID=1144313 RepID=UPI0012FAB66F|nr:hypothetical protein [Flavobacterium sp. CF136]
MKLLTSQKDHIYKYITAGGNFSPHQFKLIETDEMGRYSTSLKFINSPYYFNFNEDTDYVGFYVNYSPGQERIVEATNNVNWKIGFDHFITWLSNLKRELESPNLWERFQNEISGLQLITDFDNSKFTFSEYEELTEKLKIISQRISSIPLFENQQREIIISLERLTELAKELNKFDWKNLFIGTIISIIIQLNVTPDNATILWELIQNVFSNYFLQ